MSFIKVFLLFFLTFFLTLFLKSACATPVLFNSIENSADGKHWVGHVTLKGLPHAGKWQVGFTYASGANLHDVKGGEIVRAKHSADYGTNGGFYIIEFVAPSDGSSVSFDMLGNHAIKSYSVAPSHYFLIDSPGTDRAVIQAVREHVKITTLGKVPAEKEFIKNEKKNNKPIENNPIKTIINVNKIGIVPVPAEIKESEGEFVCNKDTPVVYTTPAAYQSAQFFSDTVAPTIGASLVVRPYKKGQTSKPAILFTTEGTEILTKEQQAEGYLLHVTPTGIVVRAASESGFFYATQSLRQLLPPDIFDKNRRKNLKTQWNIPSVEIKDYPRFSYRGLHLDVARHFIPVAQVKRLIDLMAMHKLNYFQWHLTDDEGWRIEIKKYPELTQIGGARGFNLQKKNFQYNLYPAFGSGAESYRHFYTQDEVRDIVNYAEQRRITIVPEIDMPGHARAMMMSLPQKLMDPEDSSEYTSVQGYKDNVLSPCLDGTYEVIDDVMKEVSALFPGKYIHVGGDEVPVGVWAKSPACQKWGVTAHSDDEFRQKIQNHFNSNVQKILSSYGKTMAGWEEIVNDKSELEKGKSAAVYVWNTDKFESTYALSESNRYEMILSAASHLYFDLAYDKDEREPGFYWAGYVGNYEPYAFSPIPQGKSAEVIKGVQGQLWSETILDPDKDLDYAAVPKMAGLSEMAWSLAAKRNWRDFSARMGRFHLPRLDYYGVKYRVSPPGMKIEGGRLFMNNEFSGLKMTYTIDGGVPQVYEGPVKVSGKVRAQAWSVTGRGSRLVS